MGLIALTIFLLTGVAVGKTTKPRLHFSPVVNRAGEVELFRLVNGTYNVANYGEEDIHITNTWTSNRWCVATVRDSVITPRQQTIVQVSAVVETELGQHSCRVTLESSIGNSTIWLTYKTVASNILHSDLTTIVLPESVDGLGHLRFLDSVSNDASISELSFADNVFSIENDLATLPTRISLLPKRSIQFHIHSVNKAKIVSGTVIVSGKPFGVLHVPYHISVTNKPLALYPGEVDFGTIYFTSKIYFSPVTIDIYAENISHQPLSLKKISKKMESNLESVDVQVFRSAALQPKAQSRREPGRLLSVTLSSPSPMVLDDHDGVVQVRGVIKLFTTSPDPINSIVTIPVTYKLVREGYSILPSTLVFQLYRGGPHTAMLAIRNNLDLEATMLDVNFESEADSELRKCIQLVPEASAFFGKAMSRGDLLSLRLQYSCHGKEQPVGAAIAFVFLSEAVLRVPIMIVGGKLEVEPLLVETGIFPGYLTFPPTSLVAHPSIDSTTVAFPKLGFTCLLCENDISASLKQNESAMVELGAITSPGEVKFLLNITNPNPVTMRALFYTKDPQLIRITPIIDMEHEKTIPCVDCTGSLLRNGGKSLQHNFSPIESEAGWNFTVLKMAWIVFEVKLYAPPPSDQRIHELSRALVLDTPFTRSSYSFRARAIQSCSLTSTFGASESESVKLVEWGSGEKDTTQLILASSALLNYPLSIDVEQCPDFPQFPYVHLVSNDSRLSSTTPVISENSRSIQLSLNFNIYQCLGAVAMPSVTPQDTISVMYTNRGGSESDRLCNDLKRKISVNQMLQFGIEVTRSEIRQAHEYALSWNESVRLNSPLMIQMDMLTNLAPNPLRLSMSVDLRQPSVLQCPRGLHSKSCWLSAGASSGGVGYQGSLTPLQRKSVTLRYTPVQQAEFFRLRFTIRNPSAYQMIAELTQSERIERPRAGHRPCGFIPPIGSRADDLGVLEMPFSYERTISEDFVELLREHLNELDASCAGSPKFFIPRDLYQVRMEIPAHSSRDVVVVFHSPSQGGGEKLLLDAKQQMTSLFLRNNVTLLETVHFDVQISDGYLVHPTETRSTVSVYNRVCMAQNFSPIASRIGLLFAEALLFLPPVLEGVLNYARHVPWLEEHLEPIPLIRCVPQAPTKNICTYERSSCSSKSMCFASTYKLTLELANVAKNTLKLTSVEYKLPGPGRVSSVISSVGSIDVQPGESLQLEPTLELENDLLTAEYLLVTIQTMNGYQNLLIKVVLRDDVATQEYSWISVLYTVVVGLVTVASLFKLGECEFTHSTSSTIEDAVSQQCDSGANGPTKYGDCLKETITFPKQGTEFNHGWSIVEDLQNIQVLREQRLAQ